MNRSPTINVLHVDDDSNFGDMAADLLEREDDRLTVESATSASTALEKLGEENVDCIVSDYDMPRQDGIEFLDAVREKYSDLPFILFTGKGSEDVAIRAFSNAATDYLRKASGTEQYTLLANKITNYVAKYEAERTVRRRARAMETANEGIALADQSGHYVEVNAAYAELYGTEPDRLLGSHWTVTVPDTEVERLRTEALSKAREHGSWTGEAQGQRVDGSTYAKLLSLAPLEDGGHVCVVRDISENQACAQELDETNTVLRKIINNLPMGVLVEDADREVRMVNDTLCDVLNLPQSAEELIGRDCATAAEEFKSRFADPDGFVTGIDEQITARKPARKELMLADGRVLDRYYVPYTLPAGEANLWLYRDITDRKQREHELKTLRERMLFALRTTNSLIWAVDLHGGDTEVYGNLDGLNSGHEFESLDKFIATAVHPEDTAQLRQIYAAMQRGERDEFRAEFRTHPETGTVRWMQAEGYLQTDTASPTVIGLTTDITAQKSREEELEHKNERLDKFAGVISHDLRNPLNVALGRLDLAQRECDSDHLDAVANAHSRMEALIDDLLLLAREGAKVDETEVVTLADMTDGCWRNVETADATLVTETELAIHASPSRLKQLLENLIQNAIEHGGENITVTVGDLDDGFYIADDGLGIPTENREQVFDTGFSTADDGTGFGLNIVREIAEAHDWTVKVTESDGGGARFEITGVILDSA